MYGKFPMEKRRFLNHKGLPIKNMCNGTAFSCITQKDRGYLLF